MTDLSLLERKVGSLTFQNPLIFGGGTIKTKEDALKALRTDAGGGEIGTITPHSKPGNSGNVFYAHWVRGVLIATYNSLGLINPGWDYWAMHAHEVIDGFHDSGKKIGINVAADTAMDIIDLVIKAIDAGFDWVTINAGCPNKFDENGKPLGTLTFDDRGVEVLLLRLERLVRKSDVEIWWKPSPFTDTVHALPRHVGMIASSSVITGYIANNTVPHAFMLSEDGKQVIDPGDGRAGMGGPAVKGISLGHIRTIFPLWPAEKVIIGSGGVVAGDDMVDYLRSGSDAVQMTSWVWANNMNYGVANEVLAELVDHPQFEKVMVP